MSNLLSQASLVMIPSGYKEDTVYSAIPTDGNGDLSFTRASNGTRVNSAGLVEDVAWNLITYSEEFNNAGWSIAQISVSANTTTAPNGTTTADTITTSSTGVCYIYQGFSLIGGVFTLSVYAKKGNNDFIAINNQSTSTNWVTAVFDLTDGTFGEYAVGSGGGFTYISNNIESVGNGWYRCSLVFSGVTNNTTYPSIMFAPSKTGNTFTSSYGETSGNASGKTLFIWGAQLNIGSTAKPYFPTTDRLNVPRLTYQNGGGGCPSLLLEKQSTNLCTYSEQLDNAAWTQNSTSVTANATTSPDGTQNADTITSISSSPRIVSPAAVFTSTTNVSIFVKYVSQQWVMLMSGGAVNDYANFDIQNGVIGSVGSTSSNAQIQSFGNGWYRISVTFSGYAGNTNLYFGFIASGTSAWNTFDPNFNKSLYAWGCQIENSSYPTSYIPTTSSSATRVADYPSRSGLALTNFTFAVNFKPLDYVVELFDFEKTGGGRMFYVAVQSNGFITFNGVSGGTIGAIGSVLPKNQTCKLAFSLNASTSNLKVYINGSIIGTYATNITTFGAFFGLQSFGYNPGTQIEQIAIFPSVLTDAECQSLTT